MPTLTAQAQQVMAEHGYRPGDPVGMLKGGMAAFFTTVPLGTVLGIQVAVENWAASQLSTTGVPPPVLPHPLILGWNAGVFATHVVQGAVIATLMGMGALGCAQAARHEVG